MVNIVFEGPTGAGKTSMIKKIVEHYSTQYKVGYTNDMDCKSPLYEVMKKMFEGNALITLNEGFNTIRYETLLQAADYLYSRERLYSEHNDINLFDRNYASVFSYQTVLMNEQLKDADKFMSNALLCMKSGEKPIDLMVFFGCNVNKAIKRAEKRENRNFSEKEKTKFKEFNRKLTDFIRYNNSDYKLIIIEDEDTEEKAMRKVIVKIDEILMDKIKNQNTKWYELYKADIEEFKTPDEYIKYKLKYKKKFIKRIVKYSGNNKKAIEMGCGTGIMAGYLQKMGLNVTALDLSQTVLDYAKDIALKSEVISPCKYEQGDILDLKYKKGSFDVSYSNGVLEHFNDEEIIKTLRAQMIISKYVIFGIPSTYFNMNEKMLGNERGLSLKEWKKLIEKSGGRIIEQTGFNYYRWYKRLFEFRKWFKPKAFWLFVIEKK